MCRHSAVNIAIEEPDAQYWAQEDAATMDDGNLTQADLSFAGDQSKQHVHYCQAHYRPLTLIRVF
jgi:hypothetical protein